MQPCYKAIIILIISIGLSLLEDQISCLLQREAMPFEMLTGSSKNGIENLAAEYTVSEKHQRYHLYQH